MNEAHSVQILRKEALGSELFFNHKVSYSNNGE